jgi:hypothetical protein
MSPLTLPFVRLLLAAATIGGLTPLCITAIQAATQSSQFLGPALFMTGMACSSIAASLLLIKRFPDTNRV